MLANNYNLTNQYPASGSNSYKIPTPYNNSHEYQMPTPNNNNNNPYNQMDYQRTPSQQTPNTNYAQNTNNYPMQQQNQNYYNPNPSNNNSKIGTPMNPIPNKPISLNNNYQMPTQQGQINYPMPTPPQNKVNNYQMPTPQGQINYPVTTPQGQISISNNNYPATQNQQMQSSNMSNTANYYPTPTPQSQINNKNNNNNNLLAQQQPPLKNFHLPTPQNEYLNKKNSRMPTPQSQNNPNNNNNNDNYNYPYNYTPIPTPQQQIQSNQYQNFNMNNILSKRDYVWEVKRQKAQTPSNAADYSQENSMQRANNQRNLNQQKSIKSVQQQALTNNNHNNDNNNANVPKESFRIKKKQEPVIKPYSYHKTENASNPKMKKNENNNFNNSAKQATLASTSQYPETYWEDRNRRNFMNQGFNEVKNNNNNNDAQHRGFTPNNNDNIYDSKPGSSQSNKPFQNISFKTGTPINETNYANNQNKMQMNPYMNQQIYADNGNPMNMGYGSATPQTQMNLNAGGNPNNYYANGTSIQAPLQQRDNVKFVYNRQQTQN